MTVKESRSLWIVAAIIGAIALLVGAIFWSTLSEQGWGLQWFFVIGGAFALVAGGLLALAPRTKP